MGLGRLMRSTCCKLYRVVEGDRTMSDRILVGTRKGLFDIRRSATGWGVHKVHFLGDPVSAVARDPLSGAIYASLALGHFGVKLWMTADDGDTWIERPAPAFPPRPDG